MEVQSPQSVKLAAKTARDTTDALLELPTWMMDTAARLAVTGGAEVAKRVPGSDKVGDGENTLQFFCILLRGENTICSQNLFNCLTIV